MRTTDKNIERSENGERSVAAAGVLPSSVVVVRVEDVMIPVETEESHPVMRPPAHAAEQEREANTNAARDEAEYETRAPARAKRTATDLLVDLESSVQSLTHRIEQVHSFSLAANNKLTHTDEQLRLEGALPMLEVIMRAHDSLFNRVQAAESGEREPDPYLNDIVAALESDLLHQGIEVVRPHPGDEPDVRWMTLSGNIAKPFWRPADRVAKVLACGCIRREAGGGMKILRRARVLIYR